MPKLQLHPSYICKLADVFGIRCKQKFSSALRLMKKNFSTKVFIFHYAISVLIANKDAYIKFMRQMTE